MRKFLNILVKATPKTYVDPFLGNDSNDGLSSSSPKATISSALTAKPSKQTIFVKSGTVIREEITLNKPVKLTSYGSGDKPAIIGSDIITNITAEPAGTEGTGSLAALDFEEGTTTDWTSVTTTGGTAVASTDRSRNGTYSFKITGNGTDNRVFGVKNFTALTSGQTVHVFIPFYVASGALKASTGWRLLRLLTGANTTGITVTFNTNSSGIISSVNYSDTVNSIGYLNNLPCSINLDAWNILEVSYKADATTGGGQLWLNGVSIGSRFDSNTTGYLPSRIFVGNDAFGAGMNNGSSIYFDDIKVANSGIGVYLQTNDAHRWSGTYATEPKQLFVDGQRGMRVATTGEVTSYRTWHWASNTLTVYGPANLSKPLVEASIRNGIIISSDNVTVDNIQVLHSSTFGITNSGAQSKSTIKNCYILGSFVDGIRFASSSLYSNTVIEDNEILESGANGILINENHKDTLIQRNLIHDNCRLHNNIVGGRADLEWSGGIKCWANNVNDYGSGLIIQRNTVYNNAAHTWIVADGEEASRGVGIWVDEIKVPTVTLNGPVVQDNIVFENQAWGVYLEKCQRSIARYNIIYNNAKADFTANLAIHSNSNVASYDNEVINNTVYGSGWWATLMGGSGTFTGNKFRNNIIEPDTTCNEHFYVQTNGSNSAQGQIVDYNFWSTRLRTLRINDGSVYTTLSSWRTASSQGSHSLEGNPLLSNPPTDFTLQEGSTARNAGISGVHMGAKIE